MIFDPLVVQALRSILDTTLHLFRLRPVLTYEKQPSNLTEVLKANKPVRFGQSCLKMSFGRAKLTDGIYNKRLSKIPER